MHVQNPPRFRPREACIACGSTELEPVWKGTFDRSIFAEHIGPDFYSVDVPALLAGLEFVRVRCRSCSQTFHQNVLTDEWLGRLYSEWIDEAQIARFAAEIEDGRFDRARQHVKHVLRLDALLRDVRGRPRRLLDFGCGAGDFLDSAHPFGFACYGVDVGSTRRRGEGDPVTIFPTLDDLDAAAPGELDAVTLFQVLEHLAEPREVLEQLSKRMRQGAVLVVEVPDCSGIDEPTTLEEFHNVDPLEHVNHFTPDTLTAMCRRAGFEAVRRTPAHVTTRLIDVLKTELSRFYRRPSTHQYLRKVR